MLLLLGALARELLVSYSAIATGAVMLLHDVALLLLLSPFRFLTRGNRTLEMPREVRHRLLLLLSNVTLPVGVDFPALFIGPFGSRAPFLVDIHNARLGLGGDASAEFRLHAIIRFLIGYRRKRNVVLSAADAAGRQSPSAVPPATAAAPVRRRSFFSPSQGAFSSEFVLPGTTALLASSRGFCAMVY